MRSIALRDHAVTFCQAEAGSRRAVLRRASGGGHVAEPGTETLSVADLTVNLGARTVTIRDPATEIPLTSAEYDLLLPLRTMALEASIAGVAGNFADRAWRPPSIGLPRLRRRVDDALREIILDGGWGFGTRAIEVSGTVDERVEQVLLSFRAQRGIAVVPAE